MVALTRGASVQPRITHFDRWWNSAGTWVEPANQRRGGESGVQLLAQRDADQPLLYCKRQTGHLYRSWRHPFGRPTILRELQAYRAFARVGVQTPRLVYCAARQQQVQWQALLITEALQGFVSLEQWYAGHAVAGATRPMLHQLAATLARLHRSGWQHGCCYAKHIFIRVTDETPAPVIEIALLDLEKSRRRWRTLNAARHDLRQLGRHCGAMPQTDLLLLQQAHQQALGHHGVVLPM